MRSINLPLAMLFGLGVTIGAGIYVLIGATAGRAGMHAPLAFPWTDGRAIAVAIRQLRYSAL